MSSLKNVKFTEIKQSKWKWYTEKNKKENEKPQQTHPCDIANGKQYISYQCGRKWNISDVGPFFWYCFDYAFVCYLLLL